MTECFISYDVALTFVVIAFVLFAGFLLGRMFP